MKDINFRIIPEFLEIMKDVDSTGLNVIICALLDYCETKSTEAAFRILPPNLRGPFEKYVEILDANPDFVNQEIKKAGDSDEEG